MDLLLANLFQVSFEMLTFKYCQECIEIQDSVHTHYCHSTMTFPQSYLLRLTIVIGKKDKIEHFPVL